uniref:Cytochrome P450 n=1 Tax=Phanerodontia chrysosporium TaxID=2822231 RepID=G5EJS4_PHACH|nr:cytochrome P450 [Phanerodontia chrysosporium]BAL05136.1 cytochrome P450 [Phanerodontia chrysosporium]
MAFSDVVATVVEGPWVAYMMCAVPLALLLYSLLSPASLRHIPTEGGSSLPLLSYLGAYNVLRNLRSVLQRGYDKHKGKAFKIALPDRWVVVLTGKALVDELQRMPEESASFIDATTELTGFGYIWGPRMRKDPFHVPIIRNQLTRQLSSAFGDIYEEIELSFQELMPACEKDWTPVHVIEVARDVVARASNRVFVGLRVCRNPDYLDMLVDCAVSVASARNTLMLFPSVLKTFAAKVVVNMDRRIRRGMRHLGPIIEERMSLLRSLGNDWSDKPDDMLQWIIDEVAARQMPKEDVVRNIMFLNFAAIHTSSNSFTHAIYHLAANPEYLRPLREEVEAVTAKEGWSKTAMGRMWRIDSFLRESQRVNSINPLTVIRRTRTSLTLSDGTFIPQGTVIAAPAYPTHFDDENYVGGDTFDPWRYVREKEQDLSPSKHQYVTLSPEYVPFGLGKRACPGRFFAANELKAMLAYLVVNYDVKFEKEGVRPENMHVGLTISPDPAGKVLFRKRRS